MIKKIIEQFLKSYFEEHNVEEVLSLVTDDIFWYGINKGNKADNKNTLYNKLKTRFKNHENFKVNIVQYEDKCLGNSYCAMLVYNLFDANFNTLRAVSRLAIVLILKDNEYKIAMVQFANADEEEVYVHSGNKQIINFKKYKEMVETKTLICEYNIASSTILNSDEFVSLLGFPRFAIDFPYTPDILNKICKKDAQNWIDFWLKAKDGFDNNEADIRIKNKDKFIWYNVSYKLINDGKNAIGILKDISNEKELEKLYKEEYERNDAIYDENTIELLRLDIDNDLVEKYYLYNNRDKIIESVDYVNILNNICLDIADEDSKNKFKELFSQENILKIIKSDKKSLFFEYRRRLTNNQIFWV